MIRSFWKSNMMEDYSNPPRLLYQTVNDQVAGWIPSTTPPPQQQQLISGVFFIIHRNPLNTRRIGNISIFDWLAGYANTTPTNCYWFSGWLAGPGIKFNWTKQLNNNYWASPTQPRLECSKFPKKDFLICSMGAFYVDKSNSLNFIWSID